MIGKLLILLGLTAKITWAENDDTILLVSILNSPMDIDTWSPLTPEISNKNLLQEDDSKYKLNLINIEKIEAGALCILPNLTILDIYIGGFAPKLNKDSFKGCENVKTLAIHGGEIENGAFTELEGLEAASLRFTLLPEILTAEIFEGLTSLQRLYIKDTPLKEIRGDAFRDLKNLTVLNLVEDGITVIDVDAFKNLNQLKELDLTRNRMNYFSWKHLEGLENLELLYLHFNSLYGDDAKDLLVHTIVTGPPKLREITLSPGGLNGRFYTDIVERVNPNLKLLWY